MKNFTILILTLLFIQTTAHSQPCLPEGITFSSQAQIDSFQIINPNCTEIEGNVTILGDDITNLSPLIVLTLIGGDLIIGDPEGLYQSSNPNLSSLEGLENLTSVGGSLKIYKNGALINLVGLDNLGNIEGDLIIDRNTLVNLYGLENLNVIGGDLHLEYNGDLGSLSGLWNLSSIGGSLKIIMNYGLNRLTALENLNFIGEDIEIINNNDLPDLEGLEKITHIGRDLIIAGNGSTFKRLSGLNNLTSIGRDLTIRSNYGLLNLEGLDSLKTLEGSLSIRGGNKLTSLTGLENLASIEGDLSIEYTYKLPNLTGLENIQSIGGELNISNNEILSSIAELESIDAASISNLYIIGNAALHTCHVQFVCDYLSSPNGSINITGNASGCLNPVEVADSCGFTLGCLPYGNYHFNYQSHVYNFQSMYPGCSALHGDVLIYGDDINNLFGLSQVTSIEGNLEITWADFLVNLQGLNNLVSIGGDLRIKKATALSDISALKNLVSVGGNLKITSTEELVSLNGLENLTSLSGNLELGANDRWAIWWGISGNTSLASLDGLSGLTSIGGDFHIIGSGALPDLTGLVNLESVGGDLEIYANDSLTGLNGLENLGLIEGSLFIGKLTLHDHNAYVAVTGNQSLISLEGLNGLGSIHGDLWIIGNEELDNIKGIDNIDEGSIDSLWIYENFSLASCEVKSICNYLKSPNGIVEIRDNATGCNSQEEVEEDCEDLSVDEVGHSEQLSIYPNPTSGIAHFRFQISNFGKVTLKIYDIHGREVATLSDEQKPAGEYTVSFDTQGLPPGIYIYRQSTIDNRQSTIGKLVVVK